MAKYRRYDIDMPQHVAPRRDRILHGYRSCELKLERETFVKINEIRLTTIYYMRFDSNLPYLTDTDCKE